MNKPGHSEDVHQPEIMHNNRHSTTKQGGEMRPLVRLGTGLAGGLLALSAIVGAGSASASGHPHQHHANASSGGHLTVVTSTGPWVSLDPANPTIPPTTAAMFPNFDPLFRLNSNGKIVASLATGYKVTNGGLTVTINLRHGVKFQDGTPFNAAAVAFNLEQYANPNLHSECVVYLTVMKSVRAVGKYSVQVQLSQRDAGFIPLLATQQCAFMRSPTAVQKEGAAGFASNPVGTGPFRYVGGSPGTVANFDRWNGYWGGKAKLASITIQALSSNAAALQALQSGTAQAWINIIDVGAVPQILAARAAHLQVLHAPAASITYVTFSFTHPPFNNVNARKAVIYATNAAAIDSALYHNIYKPIQGIFPPQSLAYNGPKVPGYQNFDLAKAQALVKQLGGLSFSLNVENVPSQVQLADALQAQWQKAGINVQINALDLPALIASLHNLSYQGLQINSPGLPDPDLIAYRWFYSGSALTQNGLKSSIADQYILTGRTSYRVSTRKAAYTKLNKYLVSQIAPWDDIASTTPYDIETKSVHGLPADAYAIAPWSTVTLGR